MDTVTQVVARLNDLIRRQCGPLIDELPPEVANRIVKESVGTVEASVRRCPSAGSSSARLWVANAVRIGMEDLLDALAEQYARRRIDVPNEETRKRSVRSELLKARTETRAIGRLREPDRSALLLVMYLGLPLPECEILLGGGDLAATVRIAADRMRRACEFEDRLLQEADRLVTAAWKPYPYGPITESMTAVVRDALRVQLARSGVGLLPATPDPHTLRTYYLSFGEVFRDPRQSVCELILDDRTDVKVTRDVKSLLDLEKEARTELKWLADSSRARRTLRRAEEFTVGQESRVDDWFTLVMDAGLTEHEIAKLENEQPVQTIADHVRRYNQAIWGWIDSHRIDSR